MKLNLLSYKEEKPHYKKRLLWRFVNSVVFPVLSIDKRMRIMRLFGAKTGEDSCYYRSVRVFAPWNLQIKNHVMMGEHVDVYNKDRVVIGENVIISRDVFLCTASHDTSSCSMKLVTAPIVIEDNVWIAAKATVLPGVTIGEGAVVGACSVVTKNVPSWSVVAGNPAVVVGHRTLKRD